MIIRSLRRSFFISNKLFSYLELLDSLKKNKKPDENISVTNTFRTTNRSNTIIKYMIGMEIWLYNGKEYKEFQVDSNMLGDKLGEYVFTKKICREKKKKKKKKNFKK